EDYRASTAHAVFAPNMGPLQTCTMPEKITKQKPRLDFVGEIDAVHRDPNLDRFRHIHHEGPTASNSRIFFAVSGKILTEATPKLSASPIALAIAGTAPMVPPSPIPFSVLAPLSLCTASIWIGMTSLARGN